MVARSMAFAGSTFEDKNMTIMAASLGVGSRVGAGFLPARRSRSSRRKPGLPVVFPRRHRRSAERIFADKAGCALSGGGWNRRVPGPELRRRIRARSFYVAANSNSNRGNCLGLPMPKPMSVAVATASNSPASPLEARAHLEDRPEGLSARATQFRNARAPHARRVHRIPGRSGLPRAFPSVRGIHGSILGVLS